MKRYKSIYMERTSDSVKSLVIYAENQKLFLHWFDKIWSQKYAHINNVEIRNNKLWLSMDVNIHVLEQIMQTCQEDLKIYCEIK